VIFFRVAIHTCMSNFVNWLEHRDPALWRARQDMARQTHPITIRRVQKDMKAEEDLLRRRLGMKTGRHSKVRRGL